MRFVLISWAFFVWVEATSAPYLATPPARFSFATLDECRDVRDLFLLLLTATERASGCNEER